MSRKLLAFLVSELSIVRIICQTEGCGLVIELPVAECLQSGNLPMTTCPKCCKPIGASTPDGTVQNAVAPLAKAILDLQKIEKRVQVELVLPGDEAP